MLDELDETLKAVLREIGGLSADEIDVAFEAPDREWAARVGKPTVNCYLYDIRENLTLRGTDWSVQRGANGRTATKTRAPRLFDLSYVCTAWTNDIVDEHRLVWRVLATMVQCPELPKHLLQGTLANLDVPVITEVAQPDGLLRDPADVWSALDNRIRPSVNVVVTLPLADSEPIQAPLVLTRRIRVEEPGSWAELIQFAGTVRDQNGEPVPGAVVRVRDRAYSTVTARNGSFSLAGLPAGEYTLVAETETEYGARTVEVPGPEYDLVIGADAAPSRKEKVEPSTRPAKRGEKSR